MLSPVAAGNAVTMNKATTDAIATVLRRSPEITQDRFCAVLFFMNSHTSNLNNRGWETLTQCHATLIAK